MGLEYISFVELGLSSLLYQLVFTDLHENLEGFDCGGEGGTYVMFITEMDTCKCVSWAEEEGHH